MAPLNHVPERYGTFSAKKGAFCGNGLDIFPETVVTVPETFPTSGAEPPLPQGEKGTTDAT
jgi:hypothetical protein